jgi:hypothetical protein
LDRFRKGVENTYRRREEIARLMRWLSAPRVEMSLPDETDSSDDA